MTRMETAAADGRSGSGEGDGGRGARRPTWSCSPRHRARWRGRGEDAAHAAERGPARRRSSLRRAHLEVGGGVKVRRARKLFTRHRRSLGRRNPRKNGRPGPAPPIDDVLSAPQHRAHVVHQRAARAGGRARVARAAPGVSLVRPPRVCAPANAQRRFSGKTATSATGCDARQRLPAARSPRAASMFARRAQRGAGAAGNRRSTRRFVRHVHSSRVESPRAPVHRRRAAARRPRRRHRRRVAETHRPFPGRRSLHATAKPRVVARRDARASW